jgi:hypothetical protein
MATAVGGQGKHAMAWLYDLKPGLQERLRPVARRLAARGISSSEVTSVSLALSALGGLLIIVAPRAAWPLVLLPSSCSCAPP